MSQWKKHEIEDLIVNLHNDGAGPARSWLGSNRPGLAKLLGWEYGWIGELWQVPWIYRLEAKSGTPPEPAGLWHSVWQWWRLLHFNRGVSKREGFWAPMNVDEEDTRPFKGQLQSPFVFKGMLPELSSAGLSVSWVEWGRSWFINKRQKVEPC